LNKKDQSRTPQKEMLAVAFHHTTHKKKAHRLISSLHAQKNARNLIKSNHAKKNGRRLIFFSPHTQRNG
jgi:hypothetical protein